MSNYLTVNPKTGEVRMDFYTFKSMDADSVYDHLVKRGRKLRPRVGVAVGRTLREFT